MTGQDRIATERRQQIEREGYSLEHDNEHPIQNFLDAAASYVMCMGPDCTMPVSWPWDPTAWKPKDRLRNLERAGALYLAAAEHVERHGNDGKVFRNAAANVAKMIDDLLSNDEPKSEL